VFEFKSKKKEKKKFVAFVCVCVCVCAFVAFVAFPKKNEKSRGKLFRVGFNLEFSQRVGRILSTRDNARSMPRSKSITPIS